jgi:hypothetical protein
LIDVVELISSVFGSAINSPAFKTVKSGPFEKCYFKESFVSLKSIYFINRAWYGLVAIILAFFL